MIFKRPPSASTGSILLYHRVTTLSSDPWQLCVSPRNFRKQMQFVRDNCHAVPLAEMPSILQRRPSRRPLVAVTFDDGYAETLHEALPVLEQWGIPATFFLTNPWLGPPREFWWDELERIFLQPGTLPSRLRLASDPKAPTWHLGNAAQYTAREADENRPWRAGEHPPSMRHAIYGKLWKRLYGMRPKQQQVVLDELLSWAEAEHSERPTHRRMTRDEVIRLSHSDLVEVGAHSVNHAVLPTLPLPQRKQEIELSQLTLAELVGCSVTSFAYPHGDYCPETIRLVREAGFVRGCTTREGLVKKNQDDLQLPRFNVGNWEGTNFPNTSHPGPDAPEIKSICSG